MAVTITKYTHLPKLFATGVVDWDTDTIKLALVTSSYTFSAADDEWADASANEVTTGSGYTTGGETVASKTASDTALDAADVTWTALTKTFRGAILYKSGTAGGLTNPLLAYILFDDTPADTVVVASDFPVVWNPSGIFTLA